MRTLPTVDQFPTFADTLLWLTKANNQCIWYLPDKKRYCLIENTNNSPQSVLRLAESISEVGSRMQIALGSLEEVAEQSCCARHHRNKVWGSGLAQALAIRWQKEIYFTLAAMYQSIAGPTEQGSMSALACTSAECFENLGSGSVALDPFTQTAIAHQSMPKCLPVHPVGLQAQSFNTDKPVVFAKHIVGDGETLQSKLLSSIDPNAGKAGTLYVFTYTGETFHGMIKIGYTCRGIHTRLSDWAACGYDYPVLLDSYDDVRHPERVESLTHFELMDHWYAQRWCNFHRRAHTEWFKIDIKFASSIAHLWSSWMWRANPYDRRGHLKAFWRETIAFLNENKVPITAKVMVQIQDLEESPHKVLRFTDDDELRKQYIPVIKQEPSGSSTVGSSTLRSTKHVHTSLLVPKIEALSVKIEIEEELRPFEAVTEAA